MNNPTVEDAKAIANRIGAHAVVILAFEGEFVSGSSYGQTKAICTVTGKWMNGLIDDMEVGYVAGPDFEVPK